MARSKSKPTPAKPFKKYSELRKVIDKHEAEIEDRLPLPPYWREIHVELDGSLSFGEYREVVFHPLEAVRIAHWILQFYGGVDEK